MRAARAANSGAGSAARHNQIGLRLVRLGRRVVGRASLRLLPRGRVLGFDVVAVGRGVSLDTHLPSVQRAIELISLYAPRMLARVQRDLKTLVIVAQGGEVYDHDLRAYMMDARALVRRSPERIAMAIVHEATHARLAVCGIRVDDYDELRIESLCVAQEIRLASRIPGGEPLAQKAKASLERPWWGEAQRHRLVEDQLIALGAPNWAIRLRRWLWAKRG